MALMKKALILIDKEKEQQIYKTFIAEYILYWQNEQIYWYTSKPAEHWRLGPLNRSFTYVQRYPVHRVSA